MQYIVHISDDANLRQEIIRDRFSDLGEYITTYMQVQKEGGARDPLSVGTHHFAEKGAQLEFAKYAARMKPTWTIYMATVTNLVTTDVPNPVVKKVTNEGVLPV